jgi:hypothetical protein
MGRSAVLAFLASLVLITFLSGCSKGVTGTGFRTPAAITLTPATNLSLDLGAFQSFTASARDAGNPPRTLTIPISFQSSNTAVVTIAANGLACAGSWDSLSNPQICTPGQSGVAEITAVAQGVSSPPTTVYVHQHVDSVTVAPVPGPNPVPSCVSKGQLIDYEAKAFSHGTDITSTVGPFTWTAINSQILTVSTTASGLSTSQAQITASVPGMTQLFASVAGVNGVPQSFITCPVHSIQLALSDGTPNFFTVPIHGTSKTVVATVLDSMGASITGVPLTWSSTRPPVAQVAAVTSQTANEGTVTFPTTGVAGGATINASCTPPTCDIGFAPSMPIYSLTPIVPTVTQTGTVPTGTVLAASKDCGTIDGCISLIAPISTPTNVAGVASTLPSTPNSLVFGNNQTLTAAMTRAYLGTDLSLNGTRGLMSFDPASAGGSTAPLFPNQIGEVLAVSSNGNKIILSDRISVPNQLLVFDAPGSSSARFTVTGATAADFSIDSLKAFIAAGNNLYVYSTADALNTIALPYTAIDVSYLSNGAFAYVLGTNPPTVEAYRTCDDVLADSFSPPGNPVLMKTSPDGTQVLLVSSPTTSVETFTVTPMLPAMTSGCFPTVTHGSVMSYNLGQGNFVPTQLLISSDSTKAFVVTSNLPSILSLNLADKTPSAIALVGGTTAIQAALSFDGTRIYVAANDGMVHILDTVAGTDIQQITFPVNARSLQAGLCAGLQAALNITAATQNGTSTTYTYTLTSGQPLRVGSQAVITGMTDAGNNGTFIITALGSGTFTVDNAAGVGAAGQAGSATVMVVCNPELIAVKP